LSGLCAVGTALVSGQRVGGEGGGRGATTPEPDVTKVPANTTFGQLTASTGSSVTGADVLATGSDSPVSVDMSTLSSDERITRASAEIRSPSRSITMSPGTSSAAGTGRLRAPRRTTEVSGSSAERARTARSARYSWAKLKAPFTRTTTMIATPSWRSGLPRPARKHWHVPNTR
jgi:hypothetical protein